MANNSRPREWTIRYYPYQYEKPFAVAENHTFDMQDCDEIRVVERSALDAVKSDLHSLEIAHTMILSQLRKAEAERDKWEDAFKVIAKDNEDWERQCNELERERDEREKTLGTVRDLAVERLITIHALTEALRFYATATDSVYANDGGDIARATLDKAGVK